MGDRHRPARRLRLDGQPMRVLRFLREHPGASSLEITRDLYIVNVTGRISDLRAAGYVIECRKGHNGAPDRYWIVDPKPVTEGVQQTVFQ